MGAAPAPARAAPLGSIAAMSELRRLRYFLAVANERSFTRAAERLHIAQPALSRQVRQLERELGVELLRRTTHEMELTDAGRHLVEHGPQVLAGVDRLWEQMRAYGAGEQGGVVVGYGMSAAYETAPHVLERVARELPGLAVESRVVTGGDALATVGDGGIDVGIVRCPLAGDGLETRLLRREPQGILMRHDHALAAAPAVALAALRETLLLLHPRAESPGHYDAVIALCRAAGFEPRVLERTLPFDLAQTPVAAGRAVAVVGASARLDPPTGLVWRPLAPATTLDVELVVRAAGRSPALDRFLAAAERVAAELGWLGPPGA